MIWIPVKDYEEYYQISNTGLVKSLKRTWITGRNIVRHKEETILKPVLRREGYYCVSLVKNGVVSQRYIHRLVAEHFLPNKNPKLIVNHKDGNKLNNSIENIEWCTYTDNNNHALSNKLRINPTGSDNGYSKSITVDGIKYNSIKEYAANNGVSINVAYKKFAKIKHPKNKRIFKGEVL